MKKLIYNSLNQHCNQLNPEFIWKPENHMEKLLIHSNNQNKRWNDEWQDEINNINKKIQKSSPNYQYGSNIFSQTLETQNTKSERHYEINMHLLHLLAILTCLYKN